MNAYHYRVTFHPVGQGLFSSGAIYSAQSSEPRFQWVYDCGTSSGQALLQISLQNLEDIALSRRRLDCLALSHFDRDHISGISTLLGIFKVNILLLPYVPLWKRLLIVFEEGLGSRDALFGFFIDPVAYLTALPGAEITQIVFVMPRGESDSSSPEVPAGSPPPTGDDDDRPWDVVFDEDPLRDNDELQFLIPRSTERGSVEATLRSSSQHTCGIFPRSTERGPVEASSSRRAPLFWILLSALNRARLR